MLTFNLLSVRMVVIVVYHAKEERREIIHDMTPVRPHARSMHPDLPITGQIQTTLKQRFRTAAAADAAAAMLKCRLTYLQSTRSKRFSVISDAKRILGILKFLIPH